MPRTELQITSFDPDALKQSFVDFVRTKEEFEDFNYEGSAINTLIDILVRDTTYNAYLANFLVNESFINSAQLRSSVVSHAAKLSYTPRSTTATRILCDVEVIPASTDNLETSIVMDAGTVFLTNDGTTTFSFITHQAYVVPLIVAEGIYRVRNVELFQGQRITNRFFYTTNGKVTIPNENCDTSTLIVTSKENGGGVTRVYTKPSSIDTLGSLGLNYFLSENHRQLYEIEFGKDILGEEPADGSIIEVTYIATELEHANGSSSVVAASSVDDYTNIVVNVTTPGFGGKDRESTELTRFIAPKIYQAQDRALTDSDYIPIIKSNFPFIRNAISWGGEKNVPPVYGTVFLSIISAEGELITEAIKQQIISFVEDKNVGSITPQIVDPDIFGIDLVINFAWNPKITSKTFNELSADIINITDEYSEQLNDFDQYYNDSYLNKLIQQQNGIETVDIEKRVFKDVRVLRFNNPIYTINFDNEIEPGSIRATNFELDINGENHLLYDVSGSIFAEYTLSGQTFSFNVGTVDYDTGIVEFTVNMIQSGDVFRLSCETKDDNFYVEKNRVVYINNVETNTLQTRRRSTQ